jgi:anti-anti-sigma factor
MSIEQNIEGDTGKLLLSGEIDLDSSQEVRDNIKKLIESANIVEVNLSKVNYIDSSGIAALVEGMQMAKSVSGKKFALTDVSNEVMKVIELAHLDKIFTINSKSGSNASDNGPAVNESAPEPENVSPGENVDLNQSISSDEKNSENTEQTNTTDNNSEESSPQINRDEDGEKIKFKR